MQKIVINSSGGGFSLSHTAMMMYAKMKSLNVEIYCISNEDLCLYKIYRKKIGQDIQSYQLHYCVLPVDAVFPHEVNQFFISSNSLQINDYFYLIQSDGKNKLNSFRSDPVLVEVVETLEDLSFGDYAKLKVISVPDDVIWEIWSFDSGSEMIKEVSRQWS